jgi:hypothetical protein
VQLMQGDLHFAHLVFEHLDQFRVIHFHAIWLAIAVRRIVIKALTIAEDVLALFDGLVYLLHDLCNVGDAQSQLLVRNECWLWLLVILLFWHFNNKFAIFSINKYHHQ